MSSLRLTRSLYVCDITGRRIRDISGLMQSGRVIANQDNAVQMAFDAQLSADAGVRPWVDFLAPVLEVRRASGEILKSQVGLYVSVPVRTTSRWRSRDLELDGRDLSYLLARDAFDATYTVTSSDDVMAKVSAIIQSAGIPASRIVLVPRSTAPGKPVLPTKLQTGKSFPTGMTKLQIVNELLAAIQYYAVHPDSTGRLICEPQMDLAAATPDVAYRTGNDGDVTGDVIEEPSLTSFANYVIVTSATPKSADAPLDGSGGSLAVGRTAKVTADIGLNLRSGAGLTNSIIAVQPLGTSVKIIGGPTTATGYTWWQVESHLTWGTQTGWCAAPWLSGVTGDPAPETTTKPPIVSRRYNDNASSPTSTVSLGRRWTRVETVTDIETQEQADEKANALLQESLSRYRKLTLRTFPDPRRSLYEIYDLDIVNRRGEVIADGHWYCRGWELGFTPASAAMTHTCYRIDPWVPGEPLG